MTRASRWPGPPCRGHRCRTRRSRSIRRGHARGSATGSSLPSRCRSKRVLGEDAETEEWMPGSALLGLRYEPPFPHRRLRRARHCAGGRFVSPRTAPAWSTPALLGEDDLPGHRQRPHDPQPGTPTARSTSGRDRLQASMRDADAPIIEVLRESGRLLFRAGEYEHLSALLAAALADLLRQAQLACAHHRAPRGAAVRERSRLWYPDHIKHRPLRSGSRTTWTGLSRANATGERRCRSGARIDGEVVCAAPPPSVSSAPTSRICTGSTSTRSPSSTARSSGVPDLIDVVGLRLHALRPVPRAVRERGPLRGALPGRLHS